MNTLKIAQIGCTHPHASAQIAALAACEEVGSIALCDSEWTVAEQLRASVPQRVQTSILSLDAVLHSSEISAVSITTALSEAGEIVTRAVRAGKHVLCEPAVALDAALLEEIYRNRVVIAPLLLHRQRPEVMELRRQLEQGRTGAFRHIDLRVMLEKQPHDWFCDPRLCGGLLNSKVAEFLDLAEWLPGAVVQSVFGRMDEEFGSIVLQYVGGAIGTLNFGWLPKRSDSDVSIAVRGTEGSVSLNSGDNADHATLRIDVPRQTRDIQFQHRGPSSRDLETRAACAKSFFLAIQQGLLATESSKSLVRAKRLLDACGVSSASNQPTSVEP